MKKSPKVLVLSTLFFALTANAHGKSPQQQFQQEQWAQQEQDSYESDSHVHRVNASGKFPGILIRARAKSHYRKAARDERKGNYARAEYHTSRGNELLDRKTSWHANQILKNEHLKDSNSRVSNSHKSESQKTVRYDDQTYYGKNGPIHQEQQFQDQSAHPLKNQAYGNLVSETSVVWKDGDPTQAWEDKSQWVETSQVVPNGKGKDSFPSQDFPSQENPKGGKTIADENKDQCLVLGDCFPNPKQKESKVITELPKESKPACIMYPCLTDIKGKTELPVVMKDEPIVDIQDPMPAPVQTFVPQKQQSTQRPKTEILKPIKTELQVSLPEKKPLSGKQHQEQLQEQFQQQEQVSKDKLGKGKAEDCGKLGQKPCKDKKIARLEKRIDRRNKKTDRIASKRDALLADCLDSKIDLKGKSKEIACEQKVAEHEEKASKQLFGKLFGSKGSKLSKDSPAVTQQELKTEMIRTGFGMQEIEVAPNTSGNRSGAL